MGDEDIKAENGPAIDAFVAAQEHKSTTIVMAAASQQEMTENPMRAASLTSATRTSSTESGNGTGTGNGNGNGNGNGAVRPRRKNMPYAKTTVLKLISTNATSSAFPESFGFGVSVSGRWLAAFSSSALYLISTQHLPAYKGSCRAFRIRRKPLAVAITDTGRFAVLTTSHKVDIYQCDEGRGDLLQGTCKKLETIHLDNEAKTLAFARCGEIVAAGSDVGLEIKSLSPGSRETDKRYITCSSADRLMFARDGRGLLATSVVKKSRFSTFIALNESFEDAFAEEEDIEQQPLGKLWITQLLFPERLACRQAALLPLSTSDLSNSEILAFDSHMDMFKVYDVTMKRFTERELGTPPTVIWGRHHKPEEAIPAISADASAIAFAVRIKTDKEIWVYHVPSAWWEEKETSSPESAEAEQVDNNLDAAQIVKLPAVEEGAPPETITSLQWVESTEEENDRLVALVSTVNLAMPEETAPLETPAVSGKLFLFDFAESATETGAPCEETVTVDLGDINISETLADEALAMEREVDLVRRRTQIQRSRPPVNPLPSPRGSLRRSVSSSSAGNSGGGIPTLRDLTHSNSGRSNSGRSNSGRSARRRRSFSSMSSADHGGEEGVVPVDEPYSQSQPRSQFSLHRAATIAANAPANRQHLRALPDRPLEYRRADGLREMPHESDADNWVPPPPVYSERPDNVMSHPINASAAASYVPTPQRAPSLTQHRLSRPLSNVPPVPTIPRHIRSQFSPQVIPQQAIPTAALASNATHQSFGQGSTRPRNAEEGGSSGLSGRMLERPHANASRLAAGHHRNAESASSTSSRTSQNAPVPQPSGVQTLPPPASRASAAVPVAAPANTYNMAAAAVATMSPPAMSPPGMSLVTQGLPPDMTPPSPIAEFVRPGAVRMDTPTPTSPTMPDLLPHRRSGSGNSRGTAPTDGSPLRVVPPMDLNTNLPPVPNFSPGGSRSSPRSERRPNMSRRATIASVAEHYPPSSSDFTPDPRLQSVNTEPETPVSMARKPWWRVGGGNSIRGSPSSSRPESRTTFRSESRMTARPESRMTRPDSRQIFRGQGQGRPESRVMQYAPVGEAAQRPVAQVQVPVAAAPSAKKEKEGGSRCVVM